jgi:hypothetical protein
MVYMDFYNNENRSALGNWVINFLILDVVIFTFLLLIFPALWSNGFVFVCVAIGTIVSYLIYEKLLKHKDNTWKKLAEMLVTIDISLNAIFCIIISAAIIIGVFIAARG